MAAIVPGTRIGTYTVTERIGSGGMGTVWRASGAAGDVAIKTMHPHLVEDADLVQRFEREYTVGVRARHPNLVEVLGRGKHEDAPYLVMQIATGKSIRRLLDLGGPFREWEVATLGVQLAAALGALHAAGVVHRDFKSSNVVVDRDLHAVVIDFGIARVDGERTSSVEGGFMGVAEYAGPDAFFGRPASPATDVYGLGIVLYEMLTGRVPFRASRYVDVLRMHAEHPTPRVSDIAPLVSASMDNLVFAMLDKNAASRPTAAQVEMACASILRLLGRPSAAPPVPAAPPPSPADAGLPAAESLGTWSRPRAGPSSLPAAGSRVVAGAAITLAATAGALLVVAAVIAAALE